MKQSYASAGKAPRRRVHSLSGIAAIAGCGLPPPRIMIGYPAHQARSSAEPCLSFLVLERCSARQRTVFLEHQETPCQLDQPAPYPRIASLGQALLSAFQTALVGRSREPRVARHRSSISKPPRQDLPHQHIRCLDADTDHPGEQPHHRMRPRIRCPLEPRGTCLLYRVDLLTDQCQPCHVAPQFLDDVRRQARALRCPQTCQTLWRLAQMRLESPDPETGERTLHAVGEA